MLGLLDVDNRNVDDAPFGPVPFRSAYSVVRVVEASKKVEKAAGAAGDSVWWKSQHKFITVSLPTFQDELRLKAQASAIRMYSI
jgi:hypothetical protein